MQRLDQTWGVKAPELPGAPRYVCLAMIGAGVIACAVAISEYRESLRYLWGKEFRPVAGAREAKPTASVVQPLAVLILLVGMFAFAAVLMRVP